VSKFEPWSEYNAEVVPTGGLVSGVFIIIIVVTFIIITIIVIVLYGKKRARERENLDIFKCVCVWFKPFILLVAGMEA
jgi:uncharacterized membrane protein